MNYLSFTPYVVERTELVPNHRKAEPKRMKKRRQNNLESDSVESPSLHPFFLSVVKKKLFPSWSSCVFGYVAVKLSESSPSGDHIDRNRAVLQEHLKDQGTSLFIVSLVMACGSWGVHELSAASKMRAPLFKKRSEEE